MPKTGRNTDLPARMSALATAASARAPISLGVSALVSNFTARAKVEAMGLEPTNLLRATQALYQLSYAPGGLTGYLRLPTTHLPNACSHPDVGV